MWIAGSAFSWCDVLLAVIIVELEGFAYFVEFKTFTITVIVNPFNWIFPYVFHF